MTVATELVRRIAVAEIGAAPKMVEITADIDECAALARRFGLLALDALSARASLVAVERGVVAEGSVSAQFTQNCVATDEILTQRIDEGFRIRFEPEAAVPAPDDVELSADDCDVMEHDGQEIDLGEAVAQTLGLAIDPFPRAPGADSALKATGLMDDGDVGPFAGLKGLFHKE